MAVACDITDHAAVAAGGRRAWRPRLAAIDILVNNAGWDVFRLFKDSTPADWQKLIAINLVGALNLHHAVLPGMIARGGGRIVNIASDAARVGSSGEAVYAACKAGLVGFSKTLAREHARHRINVNVVCPGATNTTCSRTIRRAPAIRTSWRKPSAAPSRWAASANRRICRARSCSSPVTTPLSLPAR